MTISRNISVLAQGASTAGILAGGYGGLGASISPTAAGNTVFSTDGSNWSSTAKIVRATLQNTTSGVAVGFTGIPSWVKRITMLFNEISSTGTSGYMVQIGSGSYVTTGYTGFGLFAPSSGASAVGTGGATNAFSIGGVNTAAMTMSGTIILCNITGNTWSYFSTATRNGGTAVQNGFQNFTALPLTLSGALDRIQILTVNGTDTFDAGSVNIFYE